MQQMQHIFQLLRSKQFRLTVVRKSVVEALSGRISPQSAKEILHQLRARGFRPNKTTIYRELYFLCAQGIARSVQFDRQESRFELAPARHHHHVVCSRCEKVEDILAEDDCRAQERKIARTKRFKILNHSLEYFGVCLNCQ